jgi:3-oxoadipate enol-lactonase
MPTVKVNGINLHYEEHTTPTSKDPLLMIMGLTFSLLDRGEDLPNELSKFYRVIVFDNRASGESDNPPGPFTIADMADDAAGLLSELKISSAHVFGISMGGMIAQELALNYPKLVQKLILGCTACKAAFSPIVLDAFVNPGSGDPPMGNYGSSGNRVVMG